MHEIFEMTVENPQQGNCCMPIYNNLKLATAHASTNLCTTVNSDTFNVLAQPVGSSPGWLNVQTHQQMVDQGSIARLP